jgi:hypothetical protein
MPVRQIPKKAGSLSGVFSSAKNGRSIAFESTLERDFYYLLEFDWNVATFEEQPVRVPYIDDEGVARSYTPDTLIHYRESPVRVELHEIKYREDLMENWVEYAPKFRAACRYARERGWGFRVTTETRIQGPYLDNVKFLLPFRDRSIPPEQVEQFLSALRARRPLSIADWLAVHARTETERLTFLPTIWHLLSSGKAFTDMERKITLNSPVRLREDRP